MSVLLQRTWALPEKKRLLLIYDLASQPFSIGDILIFQEASLVLRDSHNLDKIDIAVVYDANRPVVGDPAFAYIKPENFLFYLPSILPAAQINPYLGGAFLFDSHECLESYIADNESRYYVWPSVGLYTSKEYLFYYCFNELFYEYFKQHRKLPRLTSRPAAQAWAREFFNKHAPHSIMGTVQLRRNPADTGRNSLYAAWLEFFRHCAERYPARFLIICAPHEVDAAFRDLPNVIIAKDHHTSIEQDLALIETAAFHMGASSGPSTICQFNDKPYCIFGWNLDPAVFKGVVCEGSRRRFYFSNDHQSWIAAKETPALLAAEFERMWAILETASPTTGAPQ